MSKNTRHENLGAGRGQRAPSFQVERMDIARLEQLRRQATAQLDVIETALQSARTIATIDI